MGKIKGTGKGKAKSSRVDAVQVFRQFAWNLAGTLKGPKSAGSHQSETGRR